MCRAGRTCRNRRFIGNSYKIYQSEISSNFGWFGRCSAMGTLHIYRSRGSPQGFDARSTNSVTTLRKNFWLMQILIKTDTANITFHLSVNVYIQHFVMAALGGDIPLF